MRIRQAMGGRTAAILAAVSIVAGSMAFVFGSASANVPNALFELDRDAVPGGATQAPYDWQSLQKACPVDPAVAGSIACPTGVKAATGILQDLPSLTTTSTDTTFFTGGQSKDRYDVSKWQYGGHGAPDKNELDNAYSAAML